MVRNLSHAVTEIVAGMPVQVVGARYRCSNPHQVVEGAVVGTKVFGIKYLNPPPNQTMQVTPTAVMPAAYAPGTPAVSVPDL